MEVHFAPELQAKIDQLVIDSGCPVEELIADAMEAYIADLAQAREMLDSRYDDLKSGKGEAHRRRGSLCPPKAKTEAQRKLPHEQGTIFIPKPATTSKMWEFIRPR